MQAPTTETAVEVVDNAGKLRSLTIEPALAKRDSVLKWYTSSDANAG